MPNHSKSETAPCIYRYVIKERLDTHNRWFNYYGCKNFKQGTVCKDRKGKPCQYRKREEAPP
jgi:hypothetical protein